MADADPRATGLQQMRALQQLAAKMRSVAQDTVASAPAGASELDLHQIRRQAAAASEAVDRCCYWVAQVHKVAPQAPSK